MLLDFLDDFIIIVGYIIWFSFLVVKVKKKYIELSNIYVWYKKYKNFFVGVNYFLEVKVVRYIVDICV